MMKSSLKTGFTVFFLTEVFSFFDWVHVPKVPGRHQGQLNKWPGSLSPVGRGVPTNIQCAELAETY